jgi:hypothetical protein
MSLLAVARVSEHASSINRKPDCVRLVVGCRVGSVENVQILGRDMLRRVFTEPVG